MINFGEGVGQWYGSAPIEFCAANPDYASNSNNGVNGTDAAFCKLAVEINDVPLTPIVMGCGTQELYYGRDVAIAGFGDNTEPGGDGELDGGTTGPEPSLESPEDSDSGCGCDAGEPAAPGSGLMSLGLLSLLVVRRSRREGGARPAQRGTGVR